MFRFRSEAFAIDKARENGLRYGMSIHDGKWYVGTQEQLTKIDVLHVLTPAPIAWTVETILAREG